MTDPTPPTAPPSFRDSLADALIKCADALRNNTIEAELAAFLDERLHNAIADALTQFGAPGDPMTAWLNGWLTQIRTDYSPGGALAQSMKDAMKGIKLFLPAEHLEEKEQTAMAFDIDSLKPEVEAVLKYGQDVLDLLEQLDKVHPFDKIAKYVNDAQKALDNVKKFIEA